MHDAPRLWTEAEIATLRRMKTQSATASQIGEALGRTKNSIIGQFNRLGLSTPLSISRKRRITPRSTRKRTHETGAATMKRRAKERREIVNRARFEALENAPAPLRLSVLRVSDSQCKWPVEGEGAETLFCGHPVEPNKPYCPAHCGAAYTPYEKKPKRDTSTVRGE